MKVTRAASIPLVTHDPYFSIWSSSDHLYDTDTVHWTGKRQQIRGYLTVDKTVYCFMGDKEFHQILPQISLDVTATATTYTFENDKVRLCCCFTSPLILSDPLLVSRPCTYIDFMVEKKNADNVQLDFIVSADLVRQEKDEVAGFAGTFKQGFSYASMGRMRQQPLGSSGDHTTIDWGYVYLAGNDKSTITYDAANEVIRCQAADLNGQTTLILAYDDLASINYFGEWRKAYWTTKYKTILEAIELMKCGISICIFPEGTRNKNADDLELLPFHDGSFKIASKTGCAIIPMALNNTVEIFEAHMPKIKSTHVVLEYGKPIYVKDLPKEDQKHLGAYTQNIIHDMLEKNKPLV